MRLSDYADRYDHIEMERSDGILQLRFHTDGGPLRWGPGGAHIEFGDAFANIARDRENRVVIMTGTGEWFSGPAGAQDTFPRSTPRSWEDTRSHGTALLRGLLDIEAVVISCVNGPALRHVELPLLADIVLAADSASFQDSGHLPNRLTPGDGVQIVMPLLLGPNRGRYFLLTGETIDATEAQRLGLVAEVMPADRLLPRAWELARELIEQNPLALRYSRLLLTESLRRSVHEHLGYGLALEGLAAIDESSGEVGYSWPAN